MLRKMPKLLLASLLLSACATTGEKGGSEMSERRESAGGNDSGPSGDRETLTVGLRADTESGYAMPRSRARSAAADLRRSENANSMEAAVSATWLSGAEYQDVVAQARRLIDAELRKGEDAKVGDAVLLDLGLAAIAAKKWNQAEFYLRRAADSKNARVKAGAFTGFGMISMIEGRIPEAMSEWDTALQSAKNYKPALLNLGFTALRFGDFRAAQRYLSALEDDEFAASGLLVAERFLGNADKTGKLCDRLVEERPRHKALLLNCAIYEYQNRKNFERARMLLARMAKQAGGAEGLDERAVKVMAAIERAQAAAPRPKPAADGGGS